MAIRDADEARRTRGRSPCANFTPSCQLGTADPDVRVASHLTCNDAVGDIGPCKATLTVQRAPKRSLRAMYYAA